MSDATIAAAAFDTAVKQAQGTTKSIFDSFGVTSADPTTGKWTTGAAGSAFDPSKVMQRDATTGIITPNQSYIDSLSTTGFGTGFGYNQMSNAMEQGAANEASVAASYRGRGLGGGGLMNQARSAAESNQTRNQAGVAASLIAKLGETYGGVATSASNFMGTMVDTATVGGVTDSTTLAGTTGNTPESTTAPAAFTTLGTPGGTNVPKNPRGGQPYTGPGGTKWQYRINGPAGKGWYK